MRTFFMNSVFGPVVCSAAPSDVSCSGVPKSRINCHNAWAACDFFSIGYAFTKYDPFANMWAQVLLDIDLTLPNSVSVYNFWPLSFFALYILSV